MVSSSDLDEIMDLKTNSSGMNHDEDIERQLASLTSRVWRIEQHLGLTAPAAPPFTPEPIRSSHHPFRKLLIAFIVGIAVLYAWNNLSGTEITGILLLIAAVIAYIIVAAGDRKEPPQQL